MPLFDAVCMHCGLPGLSLMPRKAHLLRHAVNMHSQVDIHGSHNWHSAAICSASSPHAAAQTPLVACQLYS
jgi:hypothetical protein